MEVAGGSVSAYCFATGNDLRRTIVRRVFPFSRNVENNPQWPCSGSLDDGTLKGRLKIDNDSLSFPLLVPFLIYILFILLVIKSEKRRCWDTKVKETCIYIYYTCKDLVKLKD